MRRMPWNAAENSRERLLNREWIVTNGLGGYSSGTVSGAVTRKYHGLLVAALPAPLGRTVMWTHLAESLQFGERDIVLLGAEERAGGQLELGGTDYLVEFRLEHGLPVWIYDVRGIVLEKRIVMPHLQNTVHVTYRVLAGENLPRLELRPAFNFQHHEAPVDAQPPGAYRVSAIENRFDIAAPDSALPPLRMRVSGASSAFTIASANMPQVLYRTEQERGYAHVGDLWTPGFFQVDLSEQLSATLTGSTELWETIEAFGPDEALVAELDRRTRLINAADERAREGFAAELVLAADQFIITPAGRAGEAARAHAAGDEVRTVIAGYHWFTDWGRDTMISLEGLTLTTGRGAEAAYILRTFAQYARDGLIPNMFPDADNEGLYHTADATLWFFHAVHRYLRLTNDRRTLDLLLPTLVDIAEHHLRGTKFNIHVDPADGLLAQGAEGYQLTWMDAKMGDWVVTPRRGKAVELNALWHNALRLLAGWLRESGDAAAAENFSTHADRARRSFNERFWFDDGGYLYDVIDCNDETGTVDTACRPNQLFAISLDHPVLDKSRWASVLWVVERDLLTPVGLRSLSPNDPAYQPIYGGDLRSRDGAYHQGTVWGWLIGPFVDAWMKVHPGERQQARRFLEGFEHHMDEAGIGTISEVFDARAPHPPGGCIAQAWSVAEVLRCWVATAAR